MTALLDALSRYLAAELEGSSSSAPVLRVGQRRIGAGDARALDVGAIDCEFTER